MSPSKLPLLLSISSASFGPMFFRNLDRSRLSLHRHRVLEKLKSTCKGPGRAWKTSVCIEAPLCKANLRLCGSREEVLFRTLKPGESRMPVNSRPPTHWPAAETACATPCHTNQQRRAQCSCDYRCIPAAHAGTKVSMQTAGHSAGNTTAATHSTLALKTLLGSQPC